MHYEDSYVESTLWNRISMVIGALMAAAFLFAVISPVVSSAGADDSVAGVRDDGSGDLIASEDDDDDDDDQGTDNTGQPSIGSNSGNTATGTTVGTGLSQSVSDSGQGDASANTATGTTQGTGLSHSVSNSS